MLFSPSLYRVEVLRQLRNPYTLAFTLAVPVVMYLLFGGFAAFGSQSAGYGNVTFYTMVSMAAFGTATGMSSLTSLAASEVRQGWGRQLAMTPLGTAGYAVTKLVAAFTFSALAAAAVFAAGVLTGAEADDVWRWLASAAVVLGAGLVYGLYGLGIGLAFNPDSAPALASILITFFAFFGNAFMPLEGVMLDIARFTPLYGYVALARWPITEGALISGGSDPLWVPVLSIAAWTVVFVGVAWFGMLRSRRRR